MIHGLESIKAFVLEAGGTYILSKKMHEAQSKEVLSPWVVSKSALLMHKVLYIMYIHIWIQNIYI